MVKTELAIYGENVTLKFEKAKYVTNGSDAVGVVCWDDECNAWVPYCMLTVNLQTEIPSGHAFIDSNNCPMEIIDYLVSNGYIQDTFNVVPQGFCVYFMYNISKLLSEVEDAK